MAEPRHRPRRRLCPRDGPCLLPGGRAAVLFGNIAEQGCVVKTAGVDEESLQFTGPAHVCESQEAAVADILEDRVKAGDVVIVRYEGLEADPDAGDAVPDQLSQIEGAG